MSQKRLRRHRQVLLFSVATDIVFLNGAISCGTVCQL